MELEKALLLEEVAERLEAIFIKGKNIFLDKAISIDTRTMGRAQGFIALRGSKTDGHDYVKDALKKEASYLIVEKNRLDDIIPAARQQQVSILAVEDTDLALKKLAQYIFTEKSKLKEVVAVTGTAGKTTTRECLARMLSSKFRVHSAIKSHNTWIGCALTIVSMPLDTEILVLEMGTNHPGEIMEMVELFPPSIGVITSVGPGHLEGLSDIYGVVKAKTEILTSRNLHSLYYNADISLLKSAVDGYPSRFKKVGVGFERGEVKLTVNKFALNEDKAYLRVVVREGNDKYVIDSSLFGSQNAYAIGLAVAVSKDLSVSPAGIAIAMKDFSSLEGRGKIGKTPSGILYVDETYNANPLSLKASLDNIRTLEIKGKKVLVLGSMKELGDHSDYWHKAVLRETEFADVVILVGDEWPARGLAPSIIRCKNNQQVSSLLKKILKPKDVVLLKGSRSNRLEEIIHNMREW